MYDGAVKAEPPMRLLDVRHEQTAAFAAEATGKLTRMPGLAVLTAGPGVTNGISPVTQAPFGGVTTGGDRWSCPENRWGSGCAPGDRPAADRRPGHEAGQDPARPQATSPPGSTRRSRVARSSHRGPVFVDIPMDEFFNSASGPPAASSGARLEPDGDAIDGGRRAARPAPSGHS